MNKTQCLQLHTVSDSKISPLINPVNTRGTFSDKPYYCNIGDSVHRGYIQNFIFPPPILTENLDEIVKCIH